MGYPLIMLAKTAYSGWYNGAEDLVGRHSYVKDNPGEGAEKFNFVPGPTGRCFGYTVNIGGRTLARPEPTDGWLVLFVAPFCGTGRLVPVGWYDNARFEDKYVRRPEYYDDMNFPVLRDGGEYIYNLTAAGQSCFVIPPDFREQMPKLPQTGHFGQTSILYARASGKNEPWRLHYADWAESVIKAARPHAVCVGDAEPVGPLPTIMDSEPFPDQCDAHTDVHIKWQSFTPKNGSHRAWDRRRVFYAYSTDASEIVYIGKCYTSSVRGRWTAPDKNSLWQYLNSRGVDRDELTILVGRPKVVRGRLTKRFQREVESLLIYSLSPEGNIVNKVRHSSRSGVRVINGGDWPGQRNEIFSES